MSIRRRLAATLATGVAALALAGVGAGSAVAAEPIATIPDLTGQSSSVRLDSGFTDALGQLQVEPGTIGDATLEGGSVSFPITGGNVTVYRPGDANPYVQGRIEHDGSGLSLTKGDTRVELTDFVIAVIMGGDQEGCDFQPCVGLLTDIAQRVQHGFQVSATDV